MLNYTRELSNGTSDGLPDLGGWNSASWGGSLLPAVGEPVLAIVEVEMPHSVLFTYDLLRVDRDDGWFSYGDASPLEANRRVLCWMPVPAAPSFITLGTQGTDE
jgi:hypothetical protein